MSPSEFQVPKKWRVSTEPYKLLRLFLGGMGGFSLTWALTACCQVEHLITDVNNMRAELQGDEGFQVLVRFAFFRGSL